MKRFFFCWLISFQGVFLHAQMQEEPKVLHTATGDLFGSLFVPSGSKAFDVVVLQPGSGPTDRKGNNPLGVDANCYLMLADSLAQHHIATLLIDKRGIAASRAAGSDESKLVFADYIQDVEQWTALLKKDARIKKLILAGHSEGSLISMVAAQHVAVNKYISISGPAKPIDETITWQIRQQLPSLASAADSLFQRMKEGEKIDSVPPMLSTLFRPSIQPYMTSWMKYDPCKEIKKLTIPILIVQGDNDYQVREEEGTALQNCNSKAKLKIISGMNHVLKIVPRDSNENKASYTNPSLPLSTELIESIVDFIKK